MAVRPLILERRRTGRMVVRPAMCLIAVAWRASSRRPLVVAANRDEAHARPTAAAAWWEDEPNVLAGRDLTAGGTWLGIDRRGRFAAVTNLAGGGADGGRRSRGALVAEFLSGPESAAAYAERVGTGADAYGPFNLLVADGDELWFVGSRSFAHPLEPGIHAVSNVEPDVDWPKVAAAREGLIGLIDSPSLEVGLFSLLAQRRAPMNGYDARQVSPFQLDPVWGTRSSTVITIERRGGVCFMERSFDSRGATSGGVRFEFTVSRPTLAARSTEV